MFACFWRWIPCFYGEGNGNPLQCFCPENPRDIGAWWAAACGVAQSRTGVKRLSSSSCKTQKSGLRSKEETPRDPISQSNRCNAEEGLLSVAQNGWLWSPGRQSTPNSKLGKLFIDKNHSISIFHTGYKVIGYMFAKQSYWYKLRGLLFKLKAILLVQTARAFVQT